MGQLLEALRGVAMSEQKRTQMVYLDDEFEGMKSQIETLKLENRDLRAEVEPLKKNVKRLEDRLKEYEAKKDKNVVHTDLDAEEQSVIRAFVEARGMAVSAEWIASKLRLDPMKVEVHIERLRKLGLVERDMVMSTDWSGHSPETWRIAAKGKEYAVLHGIVK